MRVIILASGSEGNATLFESKTTRVLVDAGIGPRVLEQELLAAGATGLPHALVITHAHQDHVGHAASIARFHGIPIYMTDATARQAPMPATVDEYRYCAREPFLIGDLVIAPLPLPHDAAQVALTISDGESSAAIVTDLGEVTARLPEHLRDCDVVLIESNHDVDMLERGPYPWYLKRRVGSSRGHLSNAQTHALLRRLGPQAQTVVLMHISRSNNEPWLALESARDALAGRDVEVLAAPSRGRLVIDSRKRARRAPKLVQMQLSF